jgi:effector-binding domain-containing protein
MERVVVAKRPTLVVVETTTWDAFPALWGKLLDEVYAVVPGKTNVMLYRDDSPTVEVGVLAPDGAQPSGRVVASALPAGPVARAVHRGPWARLGDTHAALLRWCAQQGLELTRTRWEVYGHHRDAPAEQEAEICWQLRP